MPVRSGPGPVRTALGGLCVAAGTALLLGAVSIRARGIAWQEAHAGAFGLPGGPDDARGTGPGPGRSRERGPAPGRGEAIARLRIARLGIDAVVAEGTDAGTLELGPGHMTGTALPGDPDNCIIAGHRDGPFRRLGSARRGDLVEISDGAGTTRYEVVETRVVREDDVRDLAPATRPVLTLITCYPFNHIGPAPRRLVVRADLRGDSRKEPVTAGPPVATARRSCSSK
ncbi:MAG: class D sortase [Acidobacteria bacterium]|nr:class D sortase [Acidobacteriota bacterium]